MTQADSVHSTPPTNTSPSNPPGGPEKPQDLFYLPTDVSPEEVFQAIGRLRKDARDEIDRLMRFLDKTDDYVSRELEDDGDQGDASYPERGPHVLANPNEDDEDADPAEEAGPAEPSVAPSSAAPPLPGGATGTILPAIKGRHAAITSTMPVCLSC